MGSDSSQPIIDEQGPSDLRFQVGEEVIYAQMQTAGVESGGCVMVGRIVAKERGDSLTVFAGDDCPRIVVRLDLGEAA
jgi:hypothetical protein